MLHDYCRQLYCRTDIIYYASGGDPLDYHNKYPGARRVYGAIYQLMMREEDLQWWMNLCPGTCPNASKINCHANLMSSCPEAEVL